ncbi:hypothetical protein MHBO_003398, partial [Bonamia ostreae]
VSAKIKHFKDKNFYGLYDFKAFQLTNHKIPLEGIKTKMRLEISVNDKRSLCGFIHIIVYPGVPKRIILKSTDLKIINHSNVRNIEFGLVDEFMNSTNSSFGVSSLIFQSLNSRKVFGHFKTPLERLEDGHTFCLRDFPVTLNWEKIPKEFVSEGKLNVPFEVFAKHNEQRNMKIRHLDASFDVFPSDQITKLYLCHSLDEFTPGISKFNVEVGKLNRIYVVFESERGDIYKNIKFEQIKNFKAKLFDDNVCNLKTDEEENLVIEMDVPKKIDGIRNCYAECVLKQCPNRKLKKFFKINRIYG